MRAFIVFSSDSFLHCLRIAVSLRTVNALPCTIVKETLALSSHSLLSLKNAACRFDQWTAYGKVGGLDDQSMGWARYAQVRIFTFLPALNGNRPYCLICLL